MQTSRFYVHLYLFKKKKKKKYNINSNFSMKTQVTLLSSRKAQCHLSKGMVQFVTEVKVCSHTLIALRDSCFLFNCRNVELATAIYGLHNDDIKCIRLCGASQSINSNLVSCTSLKLHCICFFGRLAVLRNESVLELDGLKIRFLKKKKFLLDLSLCPKLSKRSRCG